MSDLTPSASWDAVVQLSGSMSAVPGTWNTPNQALLNRIEWLKVNGLFPDVNGDVLSGAAGLIGYKDGAGGSVTQTTSKSTPVTLNKPSGVITMHNESLAAGASVTFKVNNTHANTACTVSVAINDATATAGYMLTVFITTGGFIIRLKNDMAVPLAQAVGLYFTINKVATA